MVKRLSLFCLLITALILSSCSKYQKLLKSTDNDLKYNKSIEYYDKGEYYRAQQLFDQILVFYRGTDKAEKISYYNAYCYYKQKDYILGGYYFNNFVNTFPSSPFSEECSFMGAYCSYLDSPNFSLDQTNTLSAISSLQLFINQYPNSQRVDQCNQLIDELRAKLEKKAFNIAMLYYRMDDYKASIICLTNLLKEYPDTKEREKVLFSLLDAKYKYAINSIPEKKKERIESAMDAYRIINSEYPSGEYATQSSTIQKNLLKETNQ
ncbi:MAG: outer membrane protein assembly factor BamD [Bacteroidetes bacterium]|nr:outer membrane protein assembly factor BamD [Bacteroidota bacterium]